MGYKNFDHCRSCGAFGKCDCGLCSNCQSFSTRLPVANDKYGWLKSAEVVFLEPSTSTNSYCGDQAIQQYGVAKAEDGQLFPFVLCGHPSALEVAICG